jgi:hypothetical protein
MSKDKITPAMEKTCSTVSWGEAFVMERSSQDRIIGKILTLVEVMGLQEKQEQSLKDLIRQSVWKVFEDGIYISSERHSEIRNIYYEKRRETNTANTPMSAI